MSRRRLLAAGTATVLFGALGVVGASSAGAELVPVSAQTFSGNAFGTFLHAGVIQAGATGPRVVNANIGESAAAVDSQGFAKAVDDSAPTYGIGDTIAPASPSTNAYGRGSSLNVALGSSVPVTPKDQQLALFTQEAATANGAVVHNDPSQITVPASPLIYAQALHGGAGAVWDPTTCVLNQPIAAGQGYVADAQVINPSQKTNKDGSFQSAVVATDDTPDATDHVASSTSFTYITNATDKAGHPVGTGFALVSETRMILAPITLFKGMASQGAPEITIKLLGTWILKVVNGGTPDTTYVQYGPAPDQSPQTPVVQVWEGGKLQGGLNLQDILQKNGILNTSGIYLNVGAPPHVTQTGNTITATTDVVGLTLPAGAQFLGDVRVGHMVATATVPAGGINCEIPVTKVPSHASVPAGGSFTYTVSITNPPSFNCTLDPVVTSDTVKPIVGKPTFTITGSDEPGGTITKDASTGSSTISWANVGPIASGDTKTFHINIAIPADSPTGTIQDLLVIDPTATICKGNSVGGTTNIVSVLTSGGVGGSFQTVTGTTPVTVGASHTVTGPTVGIPTVVAGSKSKLAFTGSNPILPAAGVVLLALAGAFGWRRFRVRSEQ